MERAARCEGIEREYKLLSEVFGAFPLPIDVATLAFAEVRVRNSSASRGLLIIISLLRLSNCCVYKKSDMSVSLYNDGILRTLCKEDFIIPPSHGHCRSETA